VSLAAIRGNKLEYISGINLRGGEGCFPRGGGCISGEAETPRGLGFGAELIALKLSGPVRS